MKPKSHWEDFFDAHAPGYESNCFTKNTRAEADFLEEELALPKGAAILDVGCGTGRHSIELAKRGYAMTGIDLSAGMLARAKRSADAAGVTVAWLHEDATRFSLPPRFDAALGLCEGAFGLLGAADDSLDQPRSILRNIARALKPGGKAIFTVLSAARHIRMYKDEDVAAGTYDYTTLVESGAVAPHEGAEAIPTRERAFVPTEFRLLCTLEGLPVESIWGGTAGDWGRRPIKLDEFEFMVVARRGEAALKP